MKALFLSLAFSLLFISACNTGQDDAVDPAADLEQYNDFFTVNKMQVRYDREIVNHLGMPSPDWVPNGSSFFSSCVSSKRDDKKGEVVFSGFPLIGCVYAKVQGKKITFYQQDTKRRPEHIGFRNFIITPITTTILVSGSGDIIDGNVNNLHLTYTIDGLPLIDVTATLKRYVSPGGYQANIFVDPCEK